jgi:hypothetical protein
LLAAYSCFQELQLLEQTIEDSLSLMRGHERTILDGVRSEAAAGNHAYVEEARARLQDRLDNLEQNFFRIRMQEAAQGLPGQLAPPTLIQKKQELSELFRRMIREIERVQAA